MEALIEVQSQGKPTLIGRKLDVRHVIWGITVFDPDSIFTYHHQFGISIQQIRHAIMYCKDEVCEKESVIHPCTGCGKSFGKVSAYLDENAQDCAMVANQAFLKLKKQLSLPGTYQDLFL
jgi:hypothetical protein